MRLRDVGLSLFGSAVVYVAMAACSAGGGTPGAGSRPGGNGGSGTSGPAASSGASGVPSAGSGAHADSGLMDVLTDPVPSASADPADGSRLKATYRVGEDGSKEYVVGAWYDSARNEDCAFAPAGDGQLRCLPAGAAGGMFSDASCTMPIVAVSTTCTSPGYALTMDTSSCGPALGGTHVFSLGAQTTPTNLYLQSGTSCFAAGPAATGYNYFSIGGEIAPAQFVAATLGHD